MTDSDFETNYQNINTKKPAVTESAESTSVPTATAIPETDENIFVTDGNSETNSPSATPENPNSTEKPSVTATGGSQSTDTDAPSPTDSGSATSKPNATATNKPTAYPTVSPTAPPVITQGPSDYFILTLDNGGGGGYVYINQGVDSETGKPGATNVNKGWFAAGDYVSISAVPYEGCTFAGWKCGDDFISPYADYNFVMPERDYPLTAVFVF